jgi:hypothetical protein
MNVLKLGVAALVVAALGGCATAPQQPLPLSATALTGDGGRVGVAMTALPKIDTAFPGAGCLLCIAVASGVHGKMTDHVRTLPYEDLPDLKKQAAAAITKKGATAVMIDGEFKIDSLENFKSDQPNFARKDFRSLREKHNIDRLMVVDLAALGVWRDYSSYVPTSDPKAIVKGAAYMVNLRTNALEWYAPIEIAKAATTWDQPPKYPDLTNAYFQAIELGKDVVLKPLQ